MLDITAKDDVSVDCLAPPFPASSHIDRERHPAIMLAQSPERDRDIESMQTLIKNCAAAGAPSINSNMSIRGFHRPPGRPKVRGKAPHTPWRPKKITPTPPL